MWKCADEEEPKGTVCQLSTYCPFTACCMETGQGPLNVFPLPPGTALSLVSRGPGETEEGVSSPLPACCPGGLLRHASLACPRLLAVRSASPASSGSQRPVVSSFPWLPLGGSVAHCLQRGICRRSLLQPPKGGVSSRFCWCSATVAGGEWGHPPWVPSGYWLYLLSRHLNFPSLLTIWSLATPNPCL